MSADNRNVVRKITGWIGVIEKRRLWKKGFHESMRTNQWTEKQIYDYHNRKLVEIVRYAATNIPFYRELYASARIDLNRFSGVADLHNLPPISKEDLLRDGDKMIRPGMPEILLTRYTTGGSTGTIATLVGPRGISSWDSGCIFALWNRIGVKHGDRMALLRGALINGGKDMIYHDHERNSLIISTYHLNETNINQIIDQIEDFQPEWLHVYPSAADLFSNILERTGQRLRCRLKGILCGSEKVYNWQVEHIEKVFGCRVYSHYGHGEMTMLGGWCEGSRAFHFLPNHGYLELLDDNLRQVSEVGQPAEMTGTGYFNTVMPLIRYRTADFGAWDIPGACPSCNRNHQRLKTIEGRIQEYLILANGNRFPVTNINAIHGAFFSLIYRFQFVQSRPGKATFRFVPAVQLTPQNVRDIHNAFNYLDELGLKLDFESVPDIPLTKSGKQRIVMTLDIVQRE